MTVECPSCKTRFPVDHRKVPAGGVHARCSECDEVFFVADPEGFQEPAVEVFPEEIESPYEESSPFEASEPAEEEIVFSVATEEEEASPDSDEVDEDEAEEEWEAAGDEGDDDAGEAEEDGLVEPEPSGAGEDQVMDLETSSDPFATDFEVPEPAFREPEPFLGAAETTTEEESVFHAPEPDLGEATSEETAAAESPPEEADIPDDGGKEDEEESLAMEDFPSAGEMVFEPEVESLDEMEPGLEGAPRAFGGAEPIPESVEPTFGEAEPTFSMDPSEFGATPEEASDEDREEETEEATGAEEDVTWEAGSEDWIRGDTPAAGGFDAPATEEAPEEMNEVDSAGPAEEVETYAEPGGEHRAMEPPAAEGPTLPTPQFGKRDPKEKAQRLARVLVSDIILYNPDRHQRALEAGRIKEEFDDEIQKSWNEYVDQVGEDIANDTDFFNRALNEILAKGQRIF